MPPGGPRDLYDLVSEYPRRWGKGLRAALREGRRALGDAAETEDGRFLLDLPEYVVERNR